MGPMQQARLFWTLMTMSSVTPMLVKEDINEEVWGKSVPPFAATVNSAYTQMIGYNILGYHLWKMGKEL